MKLQIDMNIKGRFSKGHVPVNKSHGMYGTRFYFCYFSIKQRCEDKNHGSYERYGAKGIKLLWPTFESFRDDMYKSYLEHVERHGERQTTIDRIDSSGHYCKENCRWATYLEQGNNNKRNHYVTHNGKTQTITNWAKEIGIRKELIANRLSCGWPVKNALSTKKFHRYESGLKV